MPVPDFSPGEVLTAAAMDSIGLWKITPTSVSGAGVTLTSNNVSFSGSTEIIADGVFSSNYRDYLIMWDGQFTAGGSVLALQYRTGTTTTTNYNDNFISMVSGSVSGFFSAAQGFVRVGATDASGWTSLEAKIFCPNVASVPTRSHSTFLRNNANGPGEVSFGMQTATTQFTGLRLSITAGTMAGTMQIYGYRL